MRIDKACFLAIERGVCIIAVLIPVSFFLRSKEESKKPFSSAITNSNIIIWWTVKIPNFARSLLIKCT